MNENAASQLRQYFRNDVVSFRKTAEDFGGLSNMAPGFPLEVLGYTIKTSEALYQSCRFPHMPEVQEMILREGSPMTAKMKSKPYRKDSRPDWDDVRIPIMKWCLRIKLIQNWGEFFHLLDRSGDRAIVEDSRKDNFWGAKPDGPDMLIGENILGRLLMELRDIAREKPEQLNELLPVPIPKFLLMGQIIPTIVNEKKARPSDAMTQCERNEGPVQFGLQYHED